MGLKHRKAEEEIERESRLRLDWTLEILSWCSRLYSKQASRLAERGW